MSNKQGFTLTEILLAAVIVGMIGVALASLTRAASRESGAGNSRVMLRNSLSVAMRQLRQDVHRASRAWYVQGPIQAVSPSQEVTLLRLAQNTNALDDTFDDGDSSRQYIVYCFKKGTDYELSSGDPVEPIAAGLTKGNNKATTDGGVIERVVWNIASGDANPEDFCPADKSAASSHSTWLRHVKFISSDYTYTTTSGTKSYPVPLFSINGFDNGSTDVSQSTNRYNGNQAGEGAILDVKLIVELPSSPIVNETMEEKLIFTNGGKF